MLPCAPLTPIEFFSQNCFGSTPPFTPLQTLHATCCLDCTKMQELMAWVVVTNSPWLLKWSQSEQGEKRVPYDAITIRTHCQLEALDHVRLVPAAGVV